MIDYERLIKCLRTDAFLIELTTKNIAQDCRMAANAIEELTGKKVAYDPPFNWCGEEPIGDET